MQLAEIMITDFDTVEPTDLLSEAARALRWSPSPLLPVVDSGRLVGLVDEAALLSHHDTLEERTVRQVMRPPHPVARPFNEVEEATQRLLSLNAEALPLVERGRLLGIVTRRALLSAFSALRAQPSLHQTARSLMHAEPACVHQDDYLLDAVHRLSSSSVRALPVVDEEERVVGMLCDRDVQRVIGDLSAMLSEPELRIRVSLCRVGEVAARIPARLRLDTPLDVLAHLLTLHQASALPVLDRDQRLLGVVSYLDVMGALTGQRRHPGHAHDEEPWPSPRRAPLS